MVRVGDFYSVELNLTRSVYLKTTYIYTVSTYLSISLADHRYITVTADLKEQAIVSMRYQPGMIATHHWWVDLGQENRIDRSNQSTVHNFTPYRQCQAQVPLWKLDPFQVAPDCVCWTMYIYALNRSEAVLKESNDKASMHTMAMEQCEGKGWDDACTCHLMAV